ncbi:MAG: LysR family transcriptional regulator [Proteobacteria bacterium]|nr:LysR family transcriptional regulator [Pseudomonadota bacterium]
MNLSNLDFNLLKVLDALVTERNVTRAGRRLGRSQPAVSNALQRLRILLGDDLLVRGPGGFVLTPRAEAIRMPLRESITLIESCLAQEPSFDPSTAVNVFRVTMPDRLSIAVLPKLFARIQRVAPNMPLQVQTADRQAALDLLEDDRADLALGTFDDTPNHLRTEFLLEDHLFCVYRRDHPIARRGARFDIDAVLSYPHLIVSATGQPTAIFDDLLREHGLARRALMTVTNFTAVPQLLNATDMIGVFTKLAADVFHKSAGLAKRPVPIDVGGIATTMVWHNRYDRDRKHLWLRDQVKTVYGAL